MNYSQSESGFDGIRIVRMIFRQSPFYLDMVPDFDVLCPYVYLDALPALQEVQLISSGL